MSKPVILTGLRANNDLHIGNYFGGLLPLIDMAKNRADDYQVNLFVPDLHSFTTPIDHSKLQEQIRHNLRLYVAAGLPLNNSSVHIYRQSYVPAHSELTIILNCFTGMGQMGRMTQFKDKSRELRNKRFEEVDGLLGKVLNGPCIDIEKVKITESMMDKIRSPHEKKLLTMIRTLQATASQNEILFELKAIYMGYLEEHNELLKKSSEQLKVINENTVGEYGSIGLFDYPVLMASDILLYGARYVPVGDDQTQHLEFARDIAERMNSKFQTELFVVPEPAKKQHELFGNDQGLRIKDLVDPTKKMSKSDASGKGVIFLGDDPAVAAKKIMSATTDSVGTVRLDYENQPGISNLLQILALLTGRSLDEVAEEHDGQTEYGTFKKEVAEAVQAFLVDFQAKLQNVNEDELTEKIVASEAKMNEQANATLHRVQKAVGLR